MDRLSVGIGLAIAAMTGVAGYLAGRRAARAVGDVHGDGVNIASRIQGEIAPGQIGISDVVYDNVKNKESIQASRIGERTLKNVAASVVLYAVDA